MRTGIKVWTVVAVHVVALSFVVALLLLGFPLFLLPLPSLESLFVMVNPLKGGTVIGIKLAFIGSAALVLGQFYSVRKSLTVKLRKKVGDARAWLILHQSLGVAGSILILLHSGMPFSFKQANPFEYLHFNLGLYGLVGVAGLAAWLVTATLASGVLGWLLRGAHSPTVRRWIPAWRLTHIVLSVAMYISGTLHMTLVLVFKIISGG